jgi:hypothetical protein
MEHDDVAGSDQVQEVRTVRAQCLLVGSALGSPERAGVAANAVDPVVQALRDLEELRAAVDDQPARVDADPTRVWKEALEELGHTAAAGRGVHVDDPATAQRGPGGSSGFAEPLGTLGAN